MAADPAPTSPLTVVDEPDTAVDVDTGAASRAEVAALVARARIEGAGTVRTADPRAARRAAAVIDAIVAATPAGPDRPAGGG